MRKNQTKLIHFFEPLVALGGRTQSMMTLIDMTILNNNVKYRGCVTAYGAVTENNLGIRLNMAC